MYWNIHTNARVIQKGSTGLRPTTITINKIYYASRIPYTWSYCLETHFNVFFRRFLWIDNREEDQSGGMNTRSFSQCIYSTYTNFTIASLELQCPGLTERLHLFTVWCIHKAHGLLRTIQPQRSKRVNLAQPYQMLIWPSVREDCLSGTPPWKNWRLIPF